MYLRLGNLTVKQFADRVGAVFTDDELDVLEAHRSDHAQAIAPDRFHIFEDPAISIVIGAEAVKSLVPLFTAANARRAFSREVAFYPAGP